MNKAARSVTGNKEIELPGSMNPVLATLAFLPLMAIVLIALALAIEEAPIPLMILLAIVAGCCAMLSHTALKLMMAGKLKLDEDGITIERFLCEERYPWTSLEACKVMPATGTFGDDALIEADERAGVGLFVKGLDRQREHDLDADIVLCTGSKAHLQPLMQIAKKVQAAIKRAQQPVRRGPARPSARGPRQGQSQQFRQQRQPGARRPTAAKPNEKVDPVAAFRNR